MACTPEGFARALDAVRRTTPLVHNITNYVVMNTTANALLAAGAAPVMAHAPNEVEEMAGLAGALVLNIGTLEDAWIESMVLAGRKANADGTPVVLDPVGAGATTLRTRASRRILDEVSVQVVRGNSSEVLSLSGAGTGARGVDAVHGVDEAAGAAAALARELGCVLAITGKVDLVTDGHDAVRVHNGHALMGRVTGTGCTATALTAAFLAVEPDPLTAAAGALAFFGVAGEVAARRAAAPGSYMVALLDALYELDPNALREAAQITGPEKV